MSATEDMTMRERREAADQLVTQIPATAKAWQQAELAATRQRTVLHRMIQRAAELGVTQQRISDASGLSRQRVQQIAKGATE